MRLQHESPERGRPPVANQFIDPDQIANRLGHLFAAELQQAVVHPIAGERFLVQIRLRLRDLVLMVREKSDPLHRHECRPAHREGESTWTSTQCAIPVDRDPTAIARMARPIWPPSRARSRADRACARRSRCEHRTARSSSERWESLPYSSERTHPEIDVAVDLVCVFVLDQAARSFRRSRSTS